MYRFVFCLTLLCPIQFVWASCERSDVEYYLQQGFTAEQITVLCNGTAETPVAKPQNSAQTADQTPADAGVTSPVTAFANPSQYLVTVVDADKVRVENGRLYYIESFCFDYGAKGPFDRQHRACPEIEYGILLTGIDVVDQNKRIGLFGYNQVMVQGDISHRVINQADMSKTDQKAVVAKLADMASTAIPIRSSNDVDQAATVLREFNSAN